MIKLTTCDGDERWIDPELQDEMIDCDGDDSDLIDLLRIFEQEENDDEV